MTPQQLKAMKMALEALKNYAWHGEACPQHPTYSKPENYPKCTCGYDKAITAIKEALAEHAMREVQRLGQEIEQERNFCHRCGKRTKDIHTCTPPKETT